VVPEPAVGPPGELLPPHAQEADALRGPHAEDCT
jgi:hypothetical protein